MYDSTTCHRLRLNVRNLFAKKFIGRMSGDNFRKRLPFKFFSLPRSVRAQISASCSCVQKFTISRMASLPPSNCSTCSYFRRRYYQFVMIGSNPWTDFFLFYFHYFETIKLSISALLYYFITMMLWSKIDYPKILQCFQIILWANHFKHPLIFAHIL